MFFFKAIKYTKNYYDKDSSKELFIRLTATSLVPTVIVKESSALYSSGRELSEGGGPHVRLCQFSMMESCHLWFPGILYTNIIVT